MLARVARSPAAATRACDAAFRGCNGRHRRSTCLRCRRLRISSQSKHSVRTVRTKRSAIAFAFGARTGVLTIRMPSLRKTSSKGPLYLLSRSRIRNRRHCSANSRPRLRLLSDPGTARILRAAGEPNAPARMLDEEQHVVAAEERRLDGEEIAGDDARRLRPQELAPARAAAPRCRLQPRLRKQPADAGRRHPQAELGQLATSVAPARIFAREPQH